MGAEIETDQPAGTPAAKTARRAPRNAMLLQTELRRAGAARALTLRVRNLSDGGLMVETTEPFATGDAVTLLLRNIGEVPARVAWVDGGRIGIAFDRPIDAAAVRRTPAKSPGAGMTLLKPTAQSRRPGLKTG